MNSAMNKASTRALITLGTSAFGITSAFRDFRRARNDADKLALLDAVVSLAAVLTGVAIAVRAMREADS